MCSEQVKKQQNNSPGPCQSGKQQINHMRLEFDSLSENEGFARVAVAAFMTQLNPTVEEVADVKTAISEAVTNCIIHGYEGFSREILENIEGSCPGNVFGNSPGKIVITCAVRGKELEVTVEDKGVGIADVQKAMEPLFTTKPEQERSGMGFAFMEAFMDELHVESVLNQGTRVHMKKKIGILPWTGQDS